MRLSHYTIIFSLFCMFQVQGQTVEPDTIDVSDATAQTGMNETPVDSLAECRNIPADKLYQHVWNHTNITYSSVKIEARKDTLMVVLNSSENSKYVHPLKGGKVISAFGTARRPGHTGTDIKLQYGDSVRCVFDGKVRLAKRFSGYGNMVLVRHENGMETVYAHLAQMNVKENQELKAGELIGLGGRTGRATTDHLHFETRIFGEVFDPEKIIDFENGELRLDTFYYNRSRVEEQLADFRKGGQSNWLVSSGEAIYYSIRRGDTLTSISQMFNTSVKTLCTLNNISPQKILSIGHKLVVQTKTEPK